MKRFHALPIILFSLLAACGGLPDVTKGINEESARSTATADDISGGRLKIVVFDVGQGDAALIVAPNNEAALIDTGLPGKGNAVINPYLLSHSEIQLKHLFISHHDDDHDGSVAEMGIPIEKTYAGEAIDIGGGASISVIAQDCKFSDGTEEACDATDDNAHSAVMLIEYGAFRYLTMGDLPGGGGNPPYQTIDLETKAGQLAGDVDILHVGHHGSNTATNQTFLEEVTPEVAIISLGNGNPFWHPHQSTIERLLNAGIAIYQTEHGWLKDEYLNSVHIANGNINIESDGNNFSVNSD